VGSVTRTSRVDQAPRHMLIKDTLIKA